MPSALSSIETTSAITSFASIPAKSPDAPKVVAPSTKRITRPKEPIPQILIDEAKATKYEPFDPKKHLNYQPPSKIYSMKEIGLDGHGIAPTAVCEPFPLFTEGAIKQMRAEAFSDKCLKDCRYQSSFIKNMIRGMGHDRAPFIYDAWKSPEVLAKISEIAGVELIPAVDVDIGNVNVSINDENENSVQNWRSSDDDTLSAVAWHYDSYPFVVVTMLSDCSDMVGGETALRLQDGTIKKVRGPAMGTAVVMQGRYIEHQALKAFGGRERISMVTSFRAKSPFIKDETTLAGVRTTSVLSDLYTQFTDYRLEILEERIRAKRKEERGREVARRPFNITEMRSFLEDQIKLLQGTLDEVYALDD
ncbi:hypothetical protein GCG54_00005372 [Colletotrichum gloeosporioides]|uniref:Fe2OG dioxygenase domain-containing protein n=1 Tax=Colletotrichum gloeosporioides TaxID=474922 RepID=A0A8H8WN41_COLGL|nr:uncharacterized protein GCG54_00005372 [Colletotrichum gloeosporioides]KAF3796957.1 hypothetical protein GCG54_00005372 [Colletotrichum gloeosporioides]